RQMIVMPVRSEAVPPTPPTHATPEETGAGETESECSGIEQPSTTTNERSSIVNHSSSPEESTSPTPPSNTSRIGDSLELIDALRDSFQDNIAVLKDLSSKLKLIQREQKT